MNANQIEQAISSAIFSVLIRNGIERATVERVSPLSAARVLKDLSQDGCTVKSVLLESGTKVRTTEPDLEKRDDWYESAWNARKWGVIGSVIEHHGSHGLCYDVRHDDGSEGCYNPNEIEAV